MISDGRACFESAGGAGGPEGGRDRRRGRDDVRFFTWGIRGNACTPGRAVAPPPGGRAAVR